MDDVASGAFPVLFGDIGTAYRIIDRTDLSVLVNPYLLATNSTTRMHASRRVGGGVVQANAVKKLRMTTS
jgi:HK97 family phage major capsid protein